MSQSGWLTGALLPGVPALPQQPRPVFTYSPEAHAYSPEHNGFFKSPDGREDWIIYHANPEPGQGCGAKRAPRVQRFSWNADGTPAFEQPVALGTPIAPPSEGVHN